MLSLESSRWLVWISEQKTSLLNMFSNLMMEGLCIWLLKKIGVQKCKIIYCTSPEIMYWRKAFVIGQLLMQNVTVVAFISQQIFCLLFRILVISLWNWTVMELVSCIEEESLWQISKSLLYWYYIIIQWNSQRWMINWKIWLLHFFFQEQRT